MNTKDRSSRAVVYAAAAGLVVIAASVSAAVPRVARKVGENRVIRAESPRPYARAAAGATGRAASVWTDEVTSSGAKFIRVHFSRFDLTGGDSVVVSDAARSMSWTYTGLGPDGSGHFWSFAVPGETAIVELRAPRGGGQGYRIDAYAHGTEDVYAAEPEGFAAGDVGTESICNTDGKRDAACFPSINSRPVARLLFAAGTGQALCTGSLVVAPNANTLLTNNHCMSNQAGVSSLQAIFNFQRSTCGGATNAATSSFAGGTFLRTSPVEGGLDYTLLTLQGNPEASFGEYRAAGANVPAGRDIYIVQHPGGRVKAIARFEDAAQTNPCRIQSVSGTQTSYNCDTEGGSSGSPVLDAATNQIIALHHFGGCPNNSATMIRQICDHAGAGLLSCGGTTPTPTPPPSGNEIIIDNGGAGFSTGGGTWTASTGAAGYFGSNFLHDNNAAANPGLWAKWKPTFPSAGSYTVYARWTSHANRPNNIRYRVSANGAVIDVFRNQQTGGGTWVSLGTFNFGAGNSESNRVTLDAGSAAGFAVADAVRFVRN